MGAIAYLKLIICNYYEYKLNLKTIYGQNDVFERNIIGLETIDVYSNIIKNYIMQITNSTS